MADQFAHLEEPKSNAFMLVVVAFAIIFALLAYRVFTSASKPIEGVVESVESRMGVDDNGTPVEDVSVRLSDGSIVLAQVGEHESLHVRDEVRLMERRTSGAGLAYIAIGKHRVGAH